MAFPVDLRRVPLLPGLQDDELAELAARFRERVYDAGAAGRQPRLVGRGVLHHRRGRGGGRARRAGPSPTSAATTSSARSR